MPICPYANAQSLLGLLPRLALPRGGHALGAITDYDLSAASGRDQPLAANFFAARQVAHPAVPEVGASVCHPYLADTGFEGDDRWHTWVTHDGAPVICPPKPANRRTRRWPHAVRRAHAARRQISETVNDRLLQVFGLDDERPHAISGIRARLAAKVGLHNFCLWLNRRLGRPPLAYRSIDGPLPLTRAYTLKATAEGTRLALALEITEIRNGVAADAVIAEVIVSSAGRDLDALAALLEERTPADATLSGRAGMAR